MFCQYFPYLSTSCTPGSPFPYRTASFAPFLILHPPSTPPQVLPQPPPLVPEQATLQLSSLTFLLFTLVIFWLVPTQTPPPPHLSPVASDHFSCTSGSRYLGSTGEDQASMLVVCVASAEAAFRDWKRPGKECPAQPPGAPGRSMLAHSMGTVNHANTDEPEACERKDCGLSSAKKAG